MNAQLPTALLDTTVLDAVVLLLSLVVLLSTNNVPPVLCWNPAPTDVDRTERDQADINQAPSLLRMMHI